MIFWIASYPKSGNTWIRSLLCSYYFTKDGKFTDDSLLKNIGQFPEKKHFEKFISIIYRNTKINVEEISYLSPLWTYKLLTFLSILMIIGEVFAYKGQILSILNL